MIQNGLKTWKGFRLCAIDGTSIRLPNNPDITKYFGIQKGREGQRQMRYRKPAFWTEKRQIL
jgi:hypothetical protein